MDAREYVEEAIQTENQDFDSICERMDDIRLARILHGSMGVCTEGGELLDAVKKYIFYGKDIDVINVMEEMGDVLWYLAILSNELEIPLDVVMDYNIRKLRARYPQKFTELDAKNRRLDTERRILTERHD